MRNLLRAVAATVLVLGPTAIAFFSGGFFDRPRLIAAVVVWLLVLAGAASAHNPLPTAAAGRCAFAGLALLTAWTAASMSWAPLGQRALEDTQRLVLYSGTLGAAFMFLADARVRRWLEPGLAVGTVGVILYGLGDRLVPGLLSFQHSQSAQGRLEQPLTYWNAMGCLAAMGFVLCVRLAADQTRPTWLRAAAGAVTPILGTGVYLSLSRGALLALACGLVALILLAPARRRQAWLAAALVVIGAVAAAAATRMPKVETLAAGQTGDTGQGLAMLVVLVLTGAAAAIVVLRRWGPADPPAAPASPAGPRQRLVAALLAVGVVAGLAGVAALEGTPEARSDRPTGTARYSSADSIRYAYWDTALEAFARQPIAGTGSGGFAVEWRRRPDRPEPAVDAHSLYLETLTELGVIGGALLALLLGGVAVAATRLHRRDAAAAAGPAAVLVVWAVESGLDWNWEMPAVTGVALLLAAGILVAHDQAPA